MAVRIEKSGKLYIELYIVKSAGGQDWGGLSIRHTLFYHLKLELLGVGKISGEKRPSSLCGFRDCKS